MKLIDADNLITCLRTMSTKNDSTVWDQCITIVNSLPDEQPTVDVVDRKLFNKVCELFASDDPLWICDEMSDNYDEWEVCRANCEYTICQPQCIERYARLIIKTYEVTE